MRTIRFLTMTAFLLLSATVALAQAVNVENGVAVRGTDVVAYFTENRPVAGSPSFTHRWNGADWRFSSAKNRDAFAAAPEKYAPQYGGHCAWAVSQGYTAPIDPAAYRLVDGRLYLNYSASVQSRWQQDVPGNIAKADANWPKLRSR